MCECVATRCFSPLLCVLGTVVVVVAVAMEERISVILIKDNLYSFIDESNGPHRDYGYLLGDRLGHGSPMGILMIVCVIFSIIVNLLFLFLFRLFLLLLLIFTLLVAGFAKPLDKL